MYLCGPRKHSCQPFCGPEGRFYCSDSVCSLRPAPFSYLCMRVRILGMLKIVCSWANKTWLLPNTCCGLHFWPTLLPGSLSFYVPPHHYIIKQQAQNQIVYMCMRVRVKHTTGGTERLSNQSRQHTPSITFWHLPPNSARFGYASEGALFISTQLSTYTIRALQKVWVLIRLWKQPSTQPCT